MNPKDECSRFEAIMDRRILDETPLGDDDRAFLESHGRSCPDCGAEAAVISTLRQAGEEGLADDLDHDALECKASEVLSLQAEPESAPEAERESASEPTRESASEAAREFASDPTRESASEAARESASGPTCESASEAARESASGPEHEIKRPRPAASMKWVWVVAGSAAAAVVALGLYVLIKRPTPSRQSTTGPAVTEAGRGDARLSLVSGGVRVSGRRFAAGRALLRGDTLTVGKGRAVVIFGDSTTATVEANTTVKLVDLSRRSTLIRLERGWVGFNVRPPAAGGRFVVLTPSGKVNVLGTVFGVGHSHRGIFVQVARGRVAFHRADGPKVVVEKGRALDPTGVHPISEEERRQLLEQVKLASSLPGKGGVVVTIHTRPTGAEVKLDRQQLGWTPMSVQVAPGTRRLHLSLKGYVPVSEQFQVAESHPSALIRRLIPIDGAAATGPEAADVASAGTPGRPSGAPPAARPAAPPAARPGVPSPPTATGPTATGPTVAQLLKEARDQRSRRKWSAAIAVYRRLIRLHPKAPEARTCLVLMGQVQLRNLNRPRAALRSFERYLKGGRSGSLAREAAWGRLGCLKKLKRRQAEVRALKEFLKRYPRSIYARRVRERLAALTGRRTN